MATRKPSQGPISCDMYQKSAEDDEGRLLDAADRIYRLAQEELAATKESARVGEGMAQLLHMTVIMWANDLVDQGLLEENEPEYDELIDVLVRLELKAARRRI